MCDDAPDEDVDFTTTVDDFKTFEEKVKFYISTNSNNSLVYRIVYLQAYTETDVERFKEDVKGFAKSQEEYDALFGSDADIVCFIRKNLEINPSAIQEFLGFQKAKGLSDAQLAYAKELLTFINKNGKFERRDLLKEELFFDKLFNSIQIDALLKDIEKVL